MIVHYRIFSPDGHYTADTNVEIEGSLFGQPVRGPDGLFIPVIVSEGGTRAEAVECITDEELRPGKAYFSIKTLPC